MSRLGGPNSNLHIDGHGSNTAVLYDLDDPEKVLGSVADLLANSKVFGHCPKSHTTNIGTQQADLPHGIRIFAPHRGNAPHRGDPQTLLLSPDLQIPLTRSSAC
ncbi:hypothetical protein M885DRAFT_571470 [Pelagophyceae sp. CCMP2097]|nr:hypothetical protein M885DRAFT_571470 [Pelagophyceae sp. CCMP2097]